MQSLLNDFIASRRRTNKLSGEDVKQQLKFTSLLDLLPRTPTPALIGSEIPSTGVPLTHAKLVDFIRNKFNLTQFGLRKGDRIGVCLPQGMHCRGWARIYHL